jgi:hypothetical protein
LFCYDRASGGRTDESMNVLAGGFVITRGVEDKIWRGLIFVILLFLFSPPWQMRLFSHQNIDLVSLFLRLQLFRFSLELWDFVHVTSGPRCDSLLVLYLSSLNDMNFTISLSVSE